MAERTEELTRTRTTRESAASAPDTTSEESSGGLVSRLRPRRPRLSRLFDPKFFLLALVATLVGLFAGGFTPLGPIGSLAGLGVAAFLLGMLADERRYLEVGAAGALASGVSALLTNLFLSAAGFGVPIALFGASAGLGIAVVGFYVARDLKKGFSKEL
ncbi:MULTISPECIES: hypothetical protein [unclassified Haladaptatus]|uniref:hypothetical protein n=1 Tax=unclassified Haladaptatus TaxID=2622732 RepID=UPI0023E86580|nr:MULTISPECIES: hypothetical protein [unclassified Haladaptatus]